jgi:hypothetical protein
VTDIRLERWLWPGLTAWTLLMCLVQAPHLGTSWYFFDEGARLLRGPGGLHLYAWHPELQFGPISAVAAVPFSAAGPHAGRLLAAAVMAVTGPLLLRSVARRSQAPLPTVAAAGVPFLLVWTQLGVGAGHLDDVLALCLAVAAVHQLPRRPVVAAVLVGLAADAKPWGAAFVVVLLAVPMGRLPRAVAVWAVVVVVAWLPFVLADHTTVSALSHFTIRNSPSSTLRFFEVDTARTPPWDRAAQLMIGLALGALAVRRHGPEAGLVAVVAARLLLEPGTHIYYCGGLLAATLAYDLAVSRRPVPVLTLSAFFLYYVPQGVRSVHFFDDAASTSRALLCFSLLVVVVVLPSRLTERGSAASAGARAGRTRPAASR